MNKELMERLSEAIIRIRGNVRDAADDNITVANVETSDAQEAPTRPSLIPSPLTRRVPLPFDPETGDTERPPPPS